MEKHTKEPWLNHGQCITAEDGRLVAILPDEEWFARWADAEYGDLSAQEQRENAAFIVRACNAHAELGDALEAARHELAICAEVFAALGDPEHCLHADTRHGYDWAELRKTCRDCETDALAALAKAKGERE